MPRLLQINTTLGLGSTGKIAKVIASQAQLYGWECFFMHGSRYVGTPDSQSYQVSSKLSEFLHFVLSKFFDLHGLGSYLHTKTLIKKIKELHPDIVHIHNIHGYYANYRLLLSFLAKYNYTTLITMHDFWLITGHCAYINKRCDKWLYGCGRCPRLSDYPSAIVDNSKHNWMIKSKIFSLFKKDSLYIVPVSKWLEGFVKKSLLKNCNITCIQNGVDTNVFKPFEGEHTCLWRAIDWNKYTIITVADRWTNANGFDDVIRLSYLLPPDMQILMVGLSDCQIQELPANIIGVRHTQDVSQLVELYTSSDILFNVSKEVTFGLVTAEAMACGTPAVVFKGTAGEEIIDEKTGFAISDINEVPNLVYLSRINASVSRTLCRKRILESFDSVKQYSKYIALYNDILDVKK